MSNEENITKFIQELYLETYGKVFTIEYQDKTSYSAKQAARLVAQRKAIDKVLVESLLKYSPQVPESEIWKQIGMVHKVNVAELAEFGIDKKNQSKVIERCLSAHQSWIRLVDILLKDIFQILIMNYLKKMKSDLFYSQN